MSHHAPPVTAALRATGRSLPSALLPVRKEVAEFYQYITRRARERQPECVQEVMSATRDGRGPSTTLLEREGRKSQQHCWNREAWFLIITLLILSRFQLRCASSDRRKQPDTQ